MIGTSRRDLIKAGGLMALSAGLPATTVKAASAIPTGDQPMRFDDAQDNLEALVRMLCGTDNKIRYTAGYGRAFAILDGELQVPLFDAKVVAIQRYKRNADNSFTRQISFVQYHYTLGGKEDTEWVNPITNEATELPVFKNEFGQVDYNIYGVVVPEEMQVEGGTRPNTPQIFPWQIMDDDVWLKKEESAKYFSAREGRRVIENSIRCYQTKLSELNDRNRPSVSMTMQEFAQSELFDFLKMPEDSKGHMMWHFVAKKYETRAEVPLDIQAIVDARDPRFWNLID